MEQLGTWHFGTNNDKLVELVLNGHKTATTSIYDGNVDEINSESILLFENEKKACITKLIKNIICKFNEVEWDIAKLEGENDNLEEWTNEHYNYFKSINENFTEDSLVLIEVFEVIKNLKKERLEIGTKIAKNNDHIIGKIESIKEIDAGFNNIIFDVNNKFIIKVCGNSEKEKLFDVECNFYKENKENCSIPKLYKYDKTKSITPYVYEIIEKVNGKSVYYYWYKWNENERAQFIKRLVNTLNDIHVFKEAQDNWKNNIKNKVIENYEKCTELFTDKEKRVITEALNLYDEILSDNYYSLIHNDLHFDNILLDESNEIKIIDFNDSIIAPFDYDLRILFMCQDRPWKWANSEMDPYQKTEDYKNIRNYIKKYYSKLTSVKYLDERMYIYEILDDIKHLPKYKQKELINNIVDKSRKILN